ncbi:MAG TPA: tryptophan synthase subunit alpha [Thermomicrobiales bacterium]|nr:tryptophan synthase subunit alpha [Thermomicrobiales bacterium]
MTQRVESAPEVKIAPSRIGGAFARARRDRRTALMPFITAGYPTLAASEANILGLIRGGADIIEIGMPFSDPLADGATVQRTSQAALANGIRPGDCLDLARRLRAVHGVETPLVLMGYYNPILHYGIARFAREAAEAGVDGFIVPDLPTEESDEMHAACRAAGRDLIFMLAPTSTDARIASVAERASGFIYCVSLRGVTGARSALPDLAPYLRRVRERTTLPLAVGFGVSTAEHVRQIGKVADGAIVASALIDRLDALPPRDQPAAAEAFVRKLAEGASRPPQERG